MAKNKLVFSALAKSISVGAKYEHYKGMQYQVIAIAHHSETLEELVVYKALYGEQGVWVRPLAMFSEDVNVNGKRVPRFKLIHDS